jgi:hypothetical protein
LTILLSIVLTLTKILLPKIRTINEAVNSVYAVYAADSALEWCLLTNRTNTWSPPPFDSEGFLVDGIEAKVFLYSSSSADSLLADEENQQFCRANKIDFRAVGTYNGVSRSLSIKELDE